MFNALLKSGYHIKSEDKYILHDLPDVRTVEGSLKKKYGVNYKSHLDERTYMVKPFLQRYILTSKKKIDILLYYTVYEPITFLHVLNEWKNYIDQDFNLGIVIKDFDYWFEAHNILQPDKMLMKKVNPAFIISLKRFWSSSVRTNSFFQNWEKYFTSPTEMDSELVFSRRIDYYPEIIQFLEDARELREVGVIDE